MPNQVYPMHRFYQLSLNWNCHFYRIWLLS